MESNQQLFNIVFSVAGAPPAVRFQAFDFAVNSGIQTATRKLQQAVGVADDGHWVCEGLNQFRAVGSGYGTTAERPTLGTNDDNYCYFDTTLAKMIQWNGTAWLV